MSVSSLDLTNCDREKIHHIASIQGHGAFVSIHKVDQKIRNVSSNLSAFFGQGSDSEVLIGKRLNDFLPLELTLRIHQKLRLVDSDVQSLEFPFEGNRMMEVHMYSIAEDLAGIEFEFHDEGSDTPSQGLNVYLEDMQKAKGLREVSEVACKAVRFLTGFERVMIYRFFAPTMYGEVIAEDRVASSQAFMGHRFPSTDIPKPARDLYLRNKVRYIHDSQGENFDIRPFGHDKREPLDLSDSRLRGVSSIHLEYLINMGVRGSMSVAIIVGGNLWGIIACHHSEPQFVSQATRRLCLQVGNTLAMVAPLIENNTLVSKENHFFRSLHSFFEMIKQEADPVNFLFRKVDILNDLFSSQGVALVTPDKVTSAGLTPRTQDIRSIWDYIRGNFQGDIIQTSDLPVMNEKFLPQKDQASGLLAIKVSPLDDSMLIFMRPEKLFSILWGGDPRKNLQERNYNGKINPRASFETWTEVVSGNSMPWHDYELAGARQFRNLVFDALVRKEELIGELHERLKNKN